MAFWLQLWNSHAGTPLQPLPPQKVFKPKHELPVLASYSVPAPAEFWAIFPKNYERSVNSVINPDLLMKMGKDLGFPNSNLLARICEDIRSGAQIGCQGQFRAPSEASNAPSAINNGYRVTDAIAQWVHKKFAFGPVDPALVPRSAKFSGLMAREKPNGDVRVILNLSAPKGSSVNEGINTEEFPAVMASTTEWLRVLNRAGRNSLMAKVDWASAYKQVPVHPADSNLQWFSWLGKCFRETSLVFGCASSAGLFDRLAKLVLHIVVTKADFPARQVCQYLDNCCAASADASELSRYDEVFFEVAAQLGVELAPRSDPDKSFGPCTHGVVLGILYDTTTWLWAIPHEKWIRLLHDLKFLLQADVAPQEHIWKVMGKLIHVAPLVPCGKFNLLHIIKANSLSQNPKFPVELSPDLKRQVWFWFSMLQTCNGGVSIPDPDQRLPAWACDVYTDAAGGSLDGSARGVGAVSATWWTQLAWGAAINSGGDAGGGRKLDRVLSALELCGPLLAITAAADHLQGGSARFWVDNAASVHIFQKGYSTSCLLSAVLAAAIAQVAAFIGCKVEVLKITRCSDDWASMADALSKGAFARFATLHQRATGCRPSPSPLPVPPPLSAWVAAPSPDWDLGEKLVAYLRGRGLGLAPLL